MSSHAPGVSLNSSPVPFITWIVHVSTAVQQSFIDAPSNTTVVQGQTVILRCSVANRKGAVQWTKDGVALGEKNETAISLV